MLFKDSSNEMKFELICDIKKFNKLERTIKYEETSTFNIIFTVLRYI